MAITPNQIRLVDPFEFIITSNAVNRQFCKIVDAEYGIVQGLDVIQTGPLSVRVTDGILVCDGTAFRLDEAVVDLGGTTYQENKWNALIFKYKYMLNTPAPYGYYEVVALDSPDFHPDECVILAFLNIELTIQEVTYEHNPYVRHVNLLVRLLTLFPWIMTHDLDMKGYKIINLGDGTDDQDMVNKHQVDEAADNHEPLVKVASWDNHQSSLDGAIIPGTNMIKFIDSTDPTSPMYYLNKYDEKVSITSGDDTQEYLIGDK